MKTLAALLAAGLLAVFGAGPADADIISFDYHYPFSPGDAPWSGNLVIDPFEQGTMVTYDYTPTAVPVPGSVFLLAGGLVGLSLVRKGQ